MYPTLIQFGPLHLSTSAVIVSVASVISMFMLWKKARQEHYEDDLVFDAMLLSIFVAIVCAKVGYTLSIVPWLSLTGFADIQAAFFKNGFSEQLGLLAGLSTFFWFIKKQKWEPFEFLDFVSPSLAFFLLANWVGRFFAGAYLGTVTTLPFGLSFPSVYDRRHPLQLYFVLGYLLLIFLLYFLESRYRFFQWYRAKRQTVQSGFLFGFFLLYYGLLNAALSFFSATPLIIVSTYVSAGLGIMIALFGIWTIFYRSGHWQRKKVKTQQRFGTTPPTLLWLARLRRAFKKGDK